MVTKRLLSSPSMSSTCSEQGRFLWSQSCQMHGTECWGGGHAMIIVGCDDEQRFVRDHHCQVGIVIISAVM